MAVPTPIFIAVICMILAWALLRFTNIGLYSQAVGINASAEKAECTLAAVRGKYINVLVADEALARRMLEMEGVAVPE